jgi:hypothetical protein
MRGVSRAREKSVTPTPRRQQSFCAAEGEMQEDLVSAGGDGDSAHGEEQRWTQPFPRQALSVLKVGLFSGPIILFVERDNHQLKQSQRDQRLNLKDVQHSVVYNPEN